MKLKKTVKRHCPYCKKHTEHNVAQAKKKGRNAAHPQSKGSKKRVSDRGLRRGAGNLGRYSKPPKPKICCPVVNNEHPHESVWYCDLRCPGQNHLFPTEVFYTLVRQHQERYQLRLHLRQL